MEEKKGIRRDKTIEPPLYITMVWLMCSKNKRTEYKMEIRFFSYISLILFTEHRDSYGQYSETFVGV